MDGPWVAVWRQAMAHMSRKKRSAVSAAAEHYRAGRLTEAESLYRAVLDKHPDNVDAIQGLAVLCHQRGHPEEALALFRRASRSILTAVLPTGSSADCWSNAAIRWGLRSAIAGPGWKPALLTKRASSAETLRRPPSVNKGRRQGGSIRS